MRLREAQLLHQGGDPGLLVLQEGCDLIFMGSHGRSGWGQLLLGSVTNKVLSHTTKPVLVHRLISEPAPAEHRPPERRA